MIRRVSGDIIIDRWTGWVSAVTDLLDSSPSERFGSVVDLLEIVETPLGGGLCPVGYAAHVDEQVATLMERFPRAILLDIRLKARSRFFPVWNKSRLVARWGERYVHEPRLGNVNYQHKDRETVLLDPEGPVSQVLGWLAEGRLVILVCACQDYDRCHRKQVLQLLLQRCEMAGCGLGRLCGQEKTKGRDVVRRAFLGGCFCVMLVLCLSWFIPPVFRSAVHASQDVKAVRVSSGSASGCSVDGIVGPPSLIPDFVDRVLTFYHSPAQGTGNALYDLSRSFCIDDAVALAFFQHESSFGLHGWAVVNHSLGNIRCSVGYACNGGYRAYSTWQAGYKDWFVLIKSLYIEQFHTTTIEQIIPHYAPNADHNDERAYIAAVESAVSTWQAGRLSE